jgi:hypothetical protein
MPYVKITFDTYDDYVMAEFRPSCSIEDQGAGEQTWMHIRGEPVTEEDIEAWHRDQKPTGLPDAVEKLVIDVIAALALDETDYTIRMLYDLDPDGEPPAEEPPALETEALVQAIDALLAYKEEGSRAVITYR